MIDPDDGHFLEDTWLGHQEILLGTAGYVVLTQTSPTHTQAVISTHLISRFTVAPTRSPRRGPSLKGFWNSSGMPRGLSSLLELLAGQALLHRYGDAVANEFRSIATNQLPHHIEPRAGHEGSPGWQLQIKVRGTCSRRRRV